MGLPGQLLPRLDHRRAALDRLFRRFLRRAGQPGRGLEGIACDPDQQRRSDCFPTLARSPQQHGQQKGRKRRQDRQGPNHAAPPRRKRRRSTAPTLSNNSSGIA